MTTKLALDLPDAFAQALADSHPSGDLHEAAAYILTEYIKEGSVIGRLAQRADHKARNLAIWEAVKSGEPRASVAQRFHLSTIRVHQIMASHAALIRTENT
jgi:hypothetical protein